MSVEGGARAVGYGSITASILASMLDDYEAQVEDLTQRLNVAAADLLETRSQRAHLARQLAVAAEQAIEHAKRHAQLFEEWVRERAQLVDMLTAIRRCCELGATRTHQIETAAVLALLDGVPEVVGEWDLDTVCAQRDEARRRQQRYRLAWTSANRRARNWQDVEEMLRPLVVRYATERDEARHEVVRLGRELEQTGAEAKMYGSAYFEIQKVLDKAHGENLGDGAEAGIVADVALAVKQRDEARENDAVHTGMLKASREIVAACKRENVRLRTIIGELGAAEAAEPPPDLEHVVETPTTACVPHGDHPHRHPHDGELCDECPQCFGGAS